MDYPEKGLLVVDITEPTGLHAGEHQLTLGRKYDSRHFQSSSFFLDDEELEELFRTVVRRLFVKGLFNSGTKS